MIGKIKAEFEERVERRLNEVAAAIERGEVAEPISLSAFLISLAVSAALSTASYFISRAFAPKPPIRQEGNRAGERFDIMQSEHGLMIPEIYGREPGDGFGGCRFAPIIPWTTGPRPHREVSRQEVGGGKGPPSQTVTTERVTYDLDIALMWCRGPAETVAIFANADTVIDRRTGRISGVVDEDIDPDDDYDQGTLPDPAVDYERAVDRHNAAIIFDGDGVGTGVVLQGSYSSVADYPGSQTQPIDPTIQTEVDARLGANSTPAYRGRHYTKFAGFYLTRWAGTLPNFTGVHQHESIATLEDFCDAMCERVGMESGDYDFSALSGIDLRGLLIAGRRYQPREVLEVAARVFNFYFCETVDGQLVGRLQDEAAALTIADTEIGWIAGEVEEGQTLPELGTTVPDETTLPRRIDVKYVDPQKEFEPNLQTAARQITTGVDEQVLEVQITMLDSEAREVAQRELYQEHVEGTRHRYTLPWTYLYLDPGRVIQINRAEGFSHSIRTQGIKGGVSLLDFDGFAVETAVFTQPAVGDGGTGFEQPPVPIPAMSVAVLLDTPLLRDKDATENNGLGFVWGAVPRTGGSQTWQGAALYVNKFGWEKLDETALPATVGKVVATNVAATPDHHGIDSTGFITVDLYGDATLESVSAADIAAGANAAAVGEKVIQFLLATRVGGHPNRWTIALIYWGRRGTETLLAAPAVGETFMLLNEGVRFVPRPREDVGTTKEYRVVTAGQSLDDAATIEWTWIGRSLMPLAVAGIDTDETTGRAPRDSEGSILTTARPRSNFAEGGDEYRIRFWDDAGTEVKHAISFKEGVATAALLESHSTDKYANITRNTLTGTAGLSASVRARSLQVVRRAGNFVEATFKADDVSGGGSADLSLGYVGPAKDWRGGTVYALADYQINVEWDSVGLVHNLVARVAGAEIESVALTTAELEAGFRVRITLSGTEVRFYRDWQSSSTPPFARTPVEPTFPLRAYAAAGMSVTGAAYVEKVIMTTDPYPTTIFSADQQLEYYGTLKDPVRVTIEQYSGIREVGYGFEWTGLI